MVICLAEHNGSRMFLHTVTSLAGLFTDLSKELLPRDIEVIHIADELLLKVVLNQGGLSPGIYRRVAEHAIAAEQAGAVAFQCTCSSISPCVDTVRPLVGIPVLKIDEPMVDEALRLGDRVAVLATAIATLKPTTDLVQTRAADLGCSVQVKPVLCDGAYAALLAGDLPTHDAIVRKYVMSLMDQNDVIILAQASMARVVDGIPPEEVRVPVLSSPRLAMGRFI
jgi:Asp/Glu/hydantoin racemase